jgi:hypothetical protein
MSTIATVLHVAPVAFHPKNCANLARREELAAMIADGTSKPIIAAARVTCTLAGMVNDLSKARVSSVSHGVVQTFASDWRQL